MKKIATIAFIITVFCGLLLATNLNVHNVKAYSSASQSVFSASVTPTFDGKWTANDEWDDAMTSYVTTSTGSVVGAFRDKYVLDFSAGLSVTDNYLIEFFVDKTNDTSDYVQICYCGGADNAASPQADDFLFQIFGHNGTYKYYIGSGSGWAESSMITPTPKLGQLVSISKMNGTNPHWTYEFQFEKTVTTAGQNNYISISVFDASNPAQGVVTWPPNANSSKPNTYGLNDASALASIPEGISFAPIATLATIALIVGFFVMRKRLKT
jgi:hypothetical protein